MTIRRFFVSFSCTVSHKKRNGNGNEMTIPEVVFVCFAMLSASLCGTFNRYAVHGGEMEKHIVVILTHSEHGPCEATDSKHLIHLTVQCTMYNVQCTCLIPHREVFAQCGLQAKKTAPLSPFIRTNFSSRQAQ